MKCVNALPQDIPDISTTAFNLGAATAEVSKAYAKVMDIHARLGIVAATLANFETVLRAAIPPTSVDTSPMTIDEVENAQRAADVDATDSEGRLL